MSQPRLHHVLMSIHKEKADQLDIDAVANTFVQESEHRLGQFEKFS